MPDQTKRGDWMMSVNLIDESSNAIPISLVIFCKKREQLPVLARMGDILRIHRASLQVCTTSSQSERHEDSIPSLFILAQFSIRNGKAMFRFSDDVRVLMRSFVIRTIGGTSFQRQLLRIYSIKRTKNVHENLGRGHSNGLFRILPLMRNINLLWRI